MTSPPAPAWTFQRLTGGGRSAVAVWQLRSLQPEHRAKLSEFGVPLRAKQGVTRLIAFGDEPAEECVFVDLGGGDVEIQTHGGEAVAERVERVLQSCSGRVEPDQTFDADCWHLVQSAPTRKLAACLAHAADGNLKRELKAVQAESRPVARDRLRAAIENSTALFQTIVGHRVAIVGLPNAGKSSLLNALLGFERALTDPRPGATRDLVEAATSFDGYPITLIDSAGLRDADNEVEREGVRRSRQMSTEADTVVLVVDRGVPATRETQTLLAEFAHAIVVDHKCDREDRSTIQWPATTVSVSSRTGVGIADLMTAIDSKLSAKRFDPQQLFLPSTRCCQIASKICDQLQDPNDAATPLWADLFR